MTDLAREKKNAYQREWRSKNKERVKMHNERYWAKKAEKEINDEIEIKGE